MDDIKIKACSPDNGVAVAQLVSVFKDSYGDQFPFKGVYDPEYWSRNIGSRFISVVASRKHDILAHIAARPESNDDRVMQLCFPACAAELRADAEEVTSRAWDLLKSIADRQHWSAIYYAAFSDIELMQQIGLNVLKTTTTTILPAYIPLQNPRCASRKTSRDGARSHVVVGQRLLDGSTPGTSPLFVPAQHLEISRFLFASLGMPGVASRLNVSSKGVPTAMTVDSPALQSRVFKDWGASHFLVRPGMLSGFQESLFEFNRAEGAQRVIFVDARDATCPQYCQFLEENGYQYSGVLPSLFGTESLVYSQANDIVLDPDSFLCPVAKELARYMNEHEVQSRASAHPISALGSAKYASARS